jgi:hypothetical protein
VKRNFSMKAMHRLMVTSEAYKAASSFDPGLFAANIKADPDNVYLWHFRLQRLEAEPIWDSIWAAAGTLDTSVGGPSFDVDSFATKAGKRIRGTSAVKQLASRRGAYLVRGYSSQRNVVPHFLEVFDVDDGRTPCPLRTSTVTAPQALFLMNSTAIERACEQLAQRLKRESGGDFERAVGLAYRTTLARPPTSLEMGHALAYLDHDPTRLSGLAWLLFNLDEFIYVR